MLPFGLNEVGPSQLFSSIARMIPSSLLLRGPWLDFMLEETVLFKTRKVATGMCWGVRMMRMGSTLLMLKTAPQLDAVKVPPVLQERQASRIIRNLPILRV
jgi:hypothetical protein